MSPNTRANASAAPKKESDSDLLERLKTAADLLESIAGDRGLLAGVSEEERTRLLQAAGQVSRPEARDRRRLVKATLRQRKADKVQRAERVLARTGIRALRRKPVVTTPNVFPPIAMEQQPAEGKTECRETDE